MYVLMLVPSNFPNGDAGAVRDLAFAQIYQELGFETILIGSGRGDREGNYNGVHFYSLYKEAKTSLQHVMRFLKASAAYNKLIEKIIHSKGFPSVIHINSIPEETIAHIIQLAEEHNITIVHDSTEWYSPCEFAHGKFDKAYILKDRLNRKVIRKPIKVIGISEYLTNHFLSRGLDAIRVPVIMDIIKAEKSENTGKVKLIYAGSPANKDYLKEIVLGVSIIPEECTKLLELHVLGATEERLIDMTGLNELPSCIKAYGRVPREKVEEVMLGMDFAVLLRPSEERYTKAGFPTKTVEAMSHGVAMICNLSSDLGMYLQDGENAIIVDGHNEKAFAYSLKRVLSMSRVEIDMMKYKARLLAEENFDYRNWIKVVSDFIGVRNYD